MKYVKLVAIYLLAVLLLPGCYNSQKAHKQFSRAVIFDSKIGSDYCAGQFHSTDSTVHDTTSVTDTLFIPDGIVTDTLVYKDTVTITKTVVKTQIITNTINHTDTIFRENKAALVSCQTDNSRLVATIGPLTTDRDRLKHGRNTWRIIALISLGVNALGIFLKLKSPIKI